MFSHPVYLFLRKFSLQDSRGGSHDPDCYYLIRAFDSAESMAAALDAFYASDDWRSGPREDIVGSIEASIKTVISLPQESVEGLRVQS
ncbi:NIPSNAP family protein [Escherichia coli]|uniref:NIPSNAP family protein n=1 Tax=Escherichia coli TaxID=562 RepID=UPI0031FC441E